MLFIEVGLSKVVWVECDNGRFWWNVGILLTKETLRLNLSRAIQK